MTDEWHQQNLDRAAKDLMSAYVNRLINEFNFLAGTKHDKDTTNSKPDEAQAEHERDADR
jgi:hypothetical protein